MYFYVSLSLVQAEGAVLPQSLYQQRYVVSPLSADNFAEPEIKIHPA